jgi:hypothetical protein
MHSSSPPCVLHVLPISPAFYWLFVLYSCRFIWCIRSVKYKSCKQWEIFMTFQP